MKRMTTIFAFVMATLFVVPAFANDASSGASDAGAATDAGSPSDAVDTPAPATGTGSFNENACWDEKCPKETAACKADDMCSKFVACLKTGKSAQACGQELQLDQAKADALNKILNPLQECGWKACADPDGGSCKDQCGKYLGRTAKCQCDDQCEQYGDCCSDYKELCGGGGSGGGGSCKDKCGTPYDQNADCQCDNECESNNDCCPDYKDLCSQACVPDCAGKKCGDDGCGGVCGTCAQGNTCDSTGQCQPDKTETDAGTGAQDSGAATDAGGSSGGGTSGGGTSGGGTATPAPAAPKSSGGCTAAPSSQGALPFALVIVTLFGAVILRRRFA